MIRSAFSALILLFILLTAHGVRHAHVESGSSDTERVVPGASELRDFLTSAFAFESVFAGTADGPARPAAMTTDPVASNGVLLGTAGGFWLTVESTDDRSTTNGPRHVRSARKAPSSVRGALSPPRSIVRQALLCVYRL
ncbi:MAG: hypothetical protein WD423_12470 [Rhodothermales bacterium]